MRIGDTIVLIKCFVLLRRRYVMKIEIELNDDGDILLNGFTVHLMNHYAWALCTVYDDENQEVFESESLKECFDFCLKKGV